MHAGQGNRAAGGSCVPAPRCHRRRRFRRCCGNPPPAARPTGPPACRYRPHCAPQGQAFADWLFARFAPGSPESISPFLGMHGDGSHLSGINLGGEEETRAMLEANGLADLPPGVNVTVEEMSWLESAIPLAGGWDTAAGWLGARWAAGLRSGSAGAAGGQLLSLTRMLPCAAPPRLPACRRVQPQLNRPAAQLAGL